MTDEGPSSAKQTRYMLRSSTKNGHLVTEHNVSTERKRKRKGQLKFMDLNDDCLLAVFGNMNVIELCDVAETCKRTQALAQYHFHLKQRRLDLVSLAGHNPKLALRLLRNFGGHASSLNMARDLFPHKKEAASRKLLSLIAKYCRANVLTQLSLSQFSIALVSMKDLKELFGSLEMLKLENTTIKGCTLGPFKGNLKVLKLKDSDFCDSAYPVPVYKPLITFINTKKVLQCLSICSSTRSVPSRICQAIGELKDLKELELDEQGLGDCEKTFRQICRHLLELNHLKVLKLNCHGYSVQYLVEGLTANNVAIEHLSLKDGRFDEGFNVATAISKLESIKILKLFVMGNVNNAHLLVMAKGLKLLTELVVLGWFSVNVTQQGIVRMLRETARLSCLKIVARSFKFNINTYNEMLTIVQNRSEHIKLQLSFGNQFVAPFDPEGTLRSNDKWLSVKEI
ncbi:uncharacterized protein LOC129574906 [Sitodiplosis mosellana]|uniref:uncharacterized protein LOC129574906 n=1 Tax=Sitodiplosis mosellana TaxID=263140 RepID=UPI002443D4AB|nr:uncharacterized protein LOC129574906 [Sitodiplosis mosellana]XP_055313524.1 uncharacterized protein LOC129574906 [Sitodiplosis mosellana]